MSFAHTRQQQQSQSPNGTQRKLSQNGQVPLQQSQNKIDENSKVSQSLSDLQSQVLNYNKKESLSVLERQQYIKVCRQNADKLAKEIQNLIKKSDDKNYTFKLSKQYSEQNRKLQRIEQELGEQADLERYQEDNEGQGLLEGQQDMIDEVDFELFRETTKERKQRLFNAHRSLSTVKNVFSQIAEIATSQVDQMYQIEGNYDNADKKTSLASKELLKSQGAQRDKLNQRVLIIIILIICIIGMLFIIHQRS